MFEVVARELEFDGGPELGVGLLLIGALVFWWLLMPRFLGQAEAGFFVAMLIISMLIRWFEAIGVVIAKRWTYGDQPRQRRTLLWALPLVLTLHSGPWATGVFAFLMWHFITGPEDLQGSVWGVAAGALVMALIIASVLIRIRRQQRVSTVVIFMALPPLSNWT